MDLAGTRHWLKQIAKEILAEREGHYIIFRVSVESII